MLWSPIIKKSSESSKHNQFRDLEEIGKNIRDKYKIDVEFIVNNKFAECLDELWDYAAIETKELKSPVLRFMQVDKYLRKHTTHNKG